MLDCTGRLIRRGDRVTIGNGIEGTVVFSIDNDEFTTDFPRKDWAHLGKGIMVKTDTAGFVHLPETDEDIQVLDQNQN
jgi:hypothetical protein